MMGENDRDLDLESHLDITMSPTIGQLAMALATAQGAIRAAKRASKGQAGTRKFKYADFGMVVDTIRDALSEHGIARLQAPFTYIHPVRGLLVRVVTMLAHGESGEWVKGALDLPVVRRVQGGWEAADDPQTVGLVITFGLRYSLSALVGVASESDLDSSADSQDRQPPRRARPPASGSGRASANDARRTPADQEARDAIRALLDQRDAPPLATLDHVFGLIGMSPVALDSPAMTVVMAKDIAEYLLTGKMQPKWRAAAGGDEDLSEPDVSS